MSDASLAEVPLRTASGGSVARRGCLSSSFMATLTAPGRDDGFGAPGAERNGARPPAFLSARLACVHVMSGAASAPRATLVDPATGRPTAPPLPLTRRPGAPCAR